MRKLFRFGLSSSSDAFILVTILESIFGLIYILLDATDFFTAGLHLSYQQQSSSISDSDLDSILPPHVQQSQGSQQFDHSILIPPMIKWIISLIKFISIFILWAHVTKSVSKLSLKLWIIIGLVHDLLIPGWIIIQDILASSSITNTNNMVPLPSGEQGSDQDPSSSSSSSYPPLYRIVLLLCFRGYIYYFMIKFIHELRSGQGELYDLSMYFGDQEDNTKSSSSPSQDVEPGPGPSFGYNLNLQNIEDSTTNDDDEHEKIKKNVHFSSKVENIEIPVAGEKDSSSSGGTTNSRSSSTSLEAQPIPINKPGDYNPRLYEEDSVSYVFKLLLSMSSYEVLKRLIKIIFVVEIVWNLYVILIHEVRLGLVMIKNPPTPAISGPGSNLSSGSENIMSLIPQNQAPPTFQIFTIHETVTIQMIWIRCGFINLAVIGLYCLRFKAKKQKIALILIGILYLIMTWVNIILLIKSHDWMPLLMKKQNNNGHGQQQPQQYLINLILTGFYIICNAVLKCAVGYLIIRLGFYADAASNNNNNGLNGDYFIHESSGPPPAYFYGQEHEVDEETQDKDFESGPGLTPTKVELVFEIEQHGNGNGSDEEKPGPSCKTEL